MNGKLHGGVIATQLCVWEVGSVWINRNQIQAIATATDSTGR